MNKDFASQGPATSSKKAVNKTTALILVFVFLGLVLSVFLVFQKKTSAKHTKAITIKPKKTIKLATLTTPEKKTGNNAMTFDFYQMLSQAKVPVLNTAPPITLIKSQSYVLQIASVKNKNDALRLQKELEALGVVSTVKKATFASGQVWFRVLSNQFPDQVEAEKTQDKLRVHRIDSLLIRAPSISIN